MKNLYHALKDLIEAHDAIPSELTSEHWHDARNAIKDAKRQRTLGDLEDLAYTMIHVIARGDWGDYLDRHDPRDSDLCEASHTLESRATVLCELAAYLDARGGDGCGDHGHEAGLKEAAKVRKKVRRALGYNIP